MTADQLNKLELGSIVRNTQSESVYVIVGTHPHIGVRSIHLTNPIEWECLFQGATQQSRVPPTLKPKPPEIAQPVWFCVLWGKEETKFHGPFYDQQLAEDYAKEIEVEDDCETGVLGPVPFLLFTKPPV